MGASFWPGVGQHPNAPDGLSVQAMTFEDEVWSSPWVVAAPVGYPEYPRLAISGGNRVNMTFFVRDQAFVKLGRYIIWTVSGTTPAPRVEPREKADTPDAENGPQPTSTASPANENSEVEIAPYPSVPAKTPAITTSDKLEAPTSTISRPVLNASLLTVRPPLSFYRRIQNSEEIDRFIASHNFQ